ncbi:MAG: caspase family protein [Chthoniobacterales bacterium]
MSTPKTHIFAIAVEDYSDPAIHSVAYAKNDALAFVEVWQSLGVDPADCVTLLDEKATLGSVKSRFRKWAGNIAPHDRAIVFYTGHGAALAGENYLTVHDTAPEDIQTTSIPLAELLTTLGKPQSILLFLDLNHTEASVDAVLKKETLPSNCFAFISCAKNEITHSSKLLKHGIWMHCILQALNGEATTENKTKLTAVALQSFLAEEVPRQLRKTITGAAKQNPDLVGKPAKDYVIADLAPLLHQRHVAIENSANIIKDASLAGNTRGRVKELSGYKKPTYPLKSNTQWEQEFVHRSGTTEVAAVADTIHEKIRTSFRYKRKDIDFAKDGPTASIKTPDFDVNIALSQDPADADRYIIRTQITAFRTPQVIDDPIFLKVFSQYCDSVVIELDTTLNLQDKIDEIEETDDLADSLTYDANCTEFTLRLRDLRILLHTTANRMTFSLEGANDLPLLIANTQKAVRTLAGTHISLGLPH